MKMTSPSIKTAILSLLAGALCCLSANAQNAPSVVSASSFAGTSIGLLYNQAMDPASAAAAANYTKVSGGLSVTGAQLQPDGMTVVLRLSGVLAGPTFSVTINNVMSLANNPIAPNTVATGNVVFKQLTAADIGVGTNAVPPGVVQTNAALTNVTLDVTLPGSTFMAQDGVFQVQASGNDLNNYYQEVTNFIATPQDGFHYVYEQRTGDFDVMVHVESIDGSDASAKAGLMLRESLAPGARHYAIVVEPASTNAVDGSGPGFNGVEMLQRTSANAALSPFPVTVLDNDPDGPNPPVLLATPLPATYPFYQGTVGYIFDATGETNMFPIWLRLRLTGTNLYFYTGADGTNWYLCGRVNGLPSDWPVSAYVGLATTSAANSLYTRAQFSQYGNYVAPALKQLLMLCGSDANGASHQIGLAVGGSFGFPSALSTPAGNPNAPPLWDVSATWLYNLLLDMGYNITVVHTTTAEAGDGVDKSLVIWGGCVSSHDACDHGKWVALPVPEIDWKYATKEKNYWISTSNDRGNYVGANIQIVNNNNPITGTNGEFALGQVVQVVSNGTFFCYADTNDLWDVGSGFTIVAVDYTNPANGTLYYADVGTSLYPSANATPAQNTFASTTPARRLGLWMGDDGVGPDGDWTQTTPMGLQLLTNAINWAVGITTNAPTVAGPASQVANAGQPATFSVAVAGPGPYRFQWLKNNAPVSGASYADYTTPATAPSDNGSTFQVVVTGLHGSVTSSPPATLTVQGSLPTPSNLSFTLSGNQLSLSWSGGAGILLTSPNVALPMTSWVPVATNPPMPYIITISPGVPQMFYRAK
ncbi:MAG: hypothetical protein ABSH34_00510 [Verrucomicrobiota bacterium]|jgi:hypothetical protein